MHKIEIHCEVNNRGTYIKVDGVKLPYVKKISLTFLPNSKTLLLVDRLAAEDGKPLTVNDEFVYLTDHYAIQLGDLQLSGLKLLPHEDVE